MKLNEIKCEIQDMIKDCAVATVQAEEVDEYKTADIYKGWVEGLEYVQGLLDKVKPDTYNGYTNKPTWSIMSWINNDQVMYNHFNDKLSGMIIDAPTGKLVIELADYIKSFFMDQAILMSEFNQDSRVSVLGCVNDILGYTLDIINWEEIAEHLIDDVMEYNESEVK